MESRLAPGMDGGDLVDLVGTEPTTSSMPWKRALPAAPQAHDCRRKAEARQFGTEGSTAIIFAHITGIVNAQRFFSRVEIYHNRKQEKRK